MTKVFLKKREIGKGAVTAFTECLEWHEHFDIDKKKHAIRHAWGIRPLISVVNWWSANAKV